MVISPRSWGQSSRADTKRCGRPVSGAPRAARSDHDRVRAGKGEQDSGCGMAFPSPGRAACSSPISVVRRIRWRSPPGTARGWRAVPIYVSQPVVALGFCGPEYGPEYGGEFRGCDRRKRHRLKRCRGVDRRSFAIARRCGDRTFAPGFRASSPSRHLTLRGECRRRWWALPLLLLVCRCESRCTGDPSRWVWHGWQWPCTVRWEMVTVNPGSVASSATNRCRARPRSGVVVPQSWQTRWACSVRSVR